MTFGDPSRIARYYQTARTAHLERLVDSQPGWFFYTKHRADFDIGAAPVDSKVEKIGIFKLLLRVLRLKLDILEVPEPMAVRLWPQLIVIHVFLAIGRKIHLFETVVVSYAIENYPVSQKISQFIGIPSRLGELISKYVILLLLKTTHKIVFGTEEAARIYDATIGQSCANLTISELVWALPSASDNQVSNAGDVIFLGTFEKRKGIHELLAAWPLVKESDPTAQLTLLGMKGDIEVVRRFASDNPEVSLGEDLHRNEIFELLQKSHVLVLHSQPARGWKEQVGLPIVEALANGCEIVTSDETGIAAWLRENGHEVVPWNCHPLELATAILRARSKERTPTDLLGLLPNIDGRLQADISLFDK